MFNKTVKATAINLLLMNSRDEQTKVFKPLSLILLLLLLVTSGKNQLLAEPDPSADSSSSIDLVDLIEHGKTFAYIRLKLHVQTSSSSNKNQIPIIYQQRPNYLRAMSGKPVFTNLLGAQQQLHSYTTRASGDPIEEFASGLKVNLSSLNKTLVECFFVDLDKRYSQRVELEDKYRLLTSTRRVSFNHMMRALIECQLLTWSNPPSASHNSNKHVNNTTANSAGTEQVNPLESNNELTHRQVSTSDSQPTDLFGALFASWMHPTSSTASSAAGTAGEEQRSQLAVSTSNSIPSSSSRAVESTEVGERQQTFLNLGLSMVSGIVPNTLWCGLGDRATNYTELGLEYKVDSCCRAHDHCSVRIRPFSTDYGLVNWSMSTRSHCACDLAFNNCLVQVNSTLANVIKTLYFRLVGLQCINVADTRQQHTKLANNHQTTTIIPSIIPSS